MDPLGQPAVKSPDRIQKNVLAAAERRLLTWICARMPQWVVPDFLTSMGVVGAGMIGAGYALSTYHRDWLFLSIAGFVVHWLGDSLDGSLARFRKIERPSFGYFVDHSVDGLAALLMLGGMGLSPYIYLEITLLGLAGYLLLMIHTFLAVRVLGEMKLSHAGTGPTEVRLLLIALTLVMYFAGVARPIWGYLTAYDLFGLAAATLMIAIFIIETARTARRLDLMEREAGRGGPRLFERREP